VRRTCSAAIACALASTIGAACGHAPTAPDAWTIDAVPRQSLTVQQTLPPGMLVEGSWLAGSSDPIGLALRTSGMGFDWDIHAHIGGGTQDVASGFAQITVDYAFFPSAQGQWYLLLRNSSGATLTIDVAMDLYGQAQWAGWQ